ncbi:Hypothetical predicted protein, partial [Lynx pardinus]
MRSSPSHLPIKAKCMLPAEDQSTLPVLSCGSPQPLSRILRAQEAVQEVKQHLVKRQKSAPGVPQEGTRKDTGSRFLRPAKSQ